MDKKTIVCEHCNKKFSFVFPLKAGVFRVVCPNCNHPKYFKVLNIKK